MRQNAPIKCYYKKTEGKNWKHVIKYRYNILVPTSSISIEQHTGNKIFKKWHGWWRSRSTTMIKLLKLTVLLSSWTYRTVPCIPWWAHFSRNSSWPKKKMPKLLYVPVSRRKNLLLLYCKKRAFLLCNTRFKIIEYRYAIFLKSSFYLCWYRNYINNSNRTSTHITERIPNSIGTVPSLSLKTKEVDINERRVYSPWPPDLSVEKVARKGQAQSHLLTRQFL
jgi:hypothetical protein